MTKNCSEGYLMGLKTFSVPEFSHNFRWGKFMANIFFKAWFVAEKWGKWFYDWTLVLCPDLCPSAPPLGKYGWLWSITPPGGGLGTFAISQFFGPNFWCPRCRKNSMLFGSIWLWIVLMFWKFLLFVSENYQKLFEVFSKRRFFSFSSESDTITQLFVIPQASSGNLFATAWNEGASSFGIIRLLLPCTMSVVLVGLFEQLLISPFRPAAIHGFIFLDHVFFLNSIRSHDLQTDSFFLIK